MGPKLAGFLLPLLLILPVKGTFFSKNGTSPEDARGLRSNRRVVRLYSGTRPKPIMCEGEGFQADPTDCTIFHRCMKNGNGRYVSFRFQCGPGTIYDQDKEICNHPQSTKRTECSASIHIPNVEFTFDNEISREVPSPLSMKHPEGAEKITVKNDFSIQTTKHPDISSSSSKHPWKSTSRQNSDPAVSTSNLSINKHQQTKSPKTFSIKREITDSGYSTTPMLMSEQTFLSTTAKIRFQNAASPQTGDICESNGFVGDSENCRKFYRCISNLRGGFIRYEFLCSDPTIWDDDKKACNHVWAVKRRSCGRASLVGNSNHTRRNKQETSSEFTTTRKTTSFPTQSQLQINYGAKVTQTQTQISDGSVIQNQTQINFGNIKDVESDIVQNQTQKIYGVAVSQTQTQINYGDEAVQTQLQIDHSKKSSQAQTQVAQTSSTTKTTQFNEHQPLSTTISNNGCTESGFIGDTEDCKKFYRCVDNGSGRFTRYEFSCGEGTVWDPKLEACNHAWAVKECGGKGSFEATSQSSTKTTQSTTSISESASTVSTPTTSQSYYSSTEQESEDNNDILYGNPPSLPATNRPIEQVPSGNKEPQIPNDNKCRSSGFMGDINDCKKFYRCVDNGNRGYTRYEFNCGEGTVWDQKIEACNHAWAVQNCGGNTITETHTEKSTTTNVVHTTSTQMSSQMPPQNDDYDTGYGQQAQHDEPTSSIITTTVKSTTTTLQSLSTSDYDVGRTCISSGFMGDSHDCKKFYRCVDNGNGGFNRYEFSCGEGTVWDPKIQACNHAWAVESCSGNSNEDINKIETTTLKDTVILSSSTTQAYEPDDNNDAGYGQPNQETHSTSSTTSYPEYQNIKCTTSGFMGDPNDCKKFYRCVDNGDGTFTRYEFSCGEGTVWDSKIDSCNHAWAVERCGGPSTSTTTSPTQFINNEDNYGTYPMQNDKYPNETTTSKTSSTTTNSPNTDSVCKTSGFMSDTQNCKKFYRCVEDGHGGYIRYEFGCGEGTVWDQGIEACNHPWAVSGRCSGSGNYSNSNNIQPTTQSFTTSSEKEGEGHGYDNPTTQKTTSPSLTSTPSGTNCTQEGFYGDENSCKNFYRCVNNGQGSFIKYEFSCGEGTVWNQDIQACDHESSNNQCNIYASVSTTKKPNSEKDEMVTESTTKISESSIANNEITYTSPKPQSSGNKCQTEGFHGDPNDCKKFYRCVDNGKGNFTKYDFSCGDGTIWDQEILACNHENSNNKCSAGAVSFTTTKATPETELGSSATTQESQTTQRPSTTGTGSGGDQCTMEGFFGNTNDCRKFYRCVDNGKGSFTKYDFDCGEGTVWVQETQVCDYDNGISSCSNKDSSSTPQTIEEQQSTTVSSSTSQAITESQNSEKEDDEYSSQSSSEPSMMDKKCTSEGFFGDKNDCTRFYRCVDNGQGGYTKYDFTCGEGTAWDSNIQTCNHINEVESCQNTNEESQSKPSHDEGSAQTTENTSPTKETTSKPSTSNDKCEKEGYFGNTKDCTMFYRCVDNGKGGYTKYDFTCGEGTIWDQDLTTCNHPQDVANPSCKNGEVGQSSEHSSSTESSSSISSTSSSSSTSQSSQGTTGSSYQGSSDCSQESSSKKPGSQKVKCDKAGYYADPDDCKKFYRCVDWDGDGKRFSVYHFDCGEGTIWDPQLETCNYEDSVYPPRDCSATQSQTGNVSQETTSSTTTTTEKSTTSEQTSTTESTTIIQSTMEESTTQQSSSSEHTTQQATTTTKTTTQEPSTSKQTTTEKTTTTTQPTSSEKTTTEQSTTSEKTTTQLTTSEQTTTEQATTSQQQTTQDTATSQQTSSSETTTTTEQTTTSEPTTTQQSTTSEQTTQPATTSEQTTQSSSGEQTTTQQSSTTEESSTDSTNTEQQFTSTESSSTTTVQSSEQNSTEQQTTTEQEKTTTEGATTITTTESNENTTESSQGTTSQETASSEKDCPATEDDQYLYVCPTSFKRHPKYCNMFYQCTEDNDSHDVKITMFKCPNNTIYDENKTQCVDEDKADKKCDGQTAQRHRVKRLNKNFKEPIEASRSKLTCSTVGYYPFETDNECSGIFLKCETSKSGKLRGYVYRCPEGYTYWSISKRCEKKAYMKGCKTSDRSWRDRWDIPVEKKNIAKQL